MKLLVEIAIIVIVILVAVRFFRKKGIARSVRLWWCVELNAPTLTLGCTAKFE